MLLIPLFLEQQWAGVLILVRASTEHAYTSEEIALIQAVTAQSVLIMEYLRCFHAQAETRIRALVLHEVNHLASEFLTLASHELRTSLTGIMGHLQLAQRRLEAFKGQAAHQAGPVHERLTHVQQPLASASAAARLQQRMINDLIDDARIQTNTLPLSMHPCDLSALTRDVVARQRQAMSARTIELSMPAALRRPSVPMPAGSRRSLRPI